MSAPHLPPVGLAMASDVYTQSQETTVFTLTAFTLSEELQILLANLTVTTVPFVRYLEKGIVS